MHGRWWRKKSKVSRIGHDNEREHNANSENPPVIFFSAEKLKGQSIYQSNKECAGKRAPLLLRSLLAVLCRPEMTIGNAVIKLGYLMEKVLIGYKNNRNQMSVIYIQEQSGCNYCNKQQDQSGSQGVLICEEIWQWLIEHGVLRSKIEMNPTRSFLNFTTKKIKRTYSERAASTPHPHPQIIILCPFSSPQPISYPTPK